jgi:hypothetical protein
MLSSAFLDKLYSGLPEMEDAAQGHAAHLKNNNKVWSYVGRFITGFALVEYQVNELCCELLGGSDAAIFLTYSLDLRKKLDLIKVVLESRGIDEGKTIKRVHKFHNIRNVIAHWPFSADDSGLSCDYMDKSGDTNFEKLGTKTKDNVIEYSELDAYDAEVSELYERLDRLVGSVSPVTDMSDDLRRSIEDAISSSDNVVRLPIKDPK